MLSSVERWAFELKNGLLSLLLGVGGPFASWPGMADGDTNGRSAGEAKARAVGNCGSLLIDCEEIAPLEEGWAFFSLVMVNSDGSLAELLCFRRLLIGPWKSLGDACRERLRDV